MFYLATYGSVAICNKFNKQTDRLLTCNKSDIIIPKKLDHSLDFGSYSEGYSARLFVLAQRILALIICVSERIMKAMSLS